MAKQPSIQDPNLVTALIAHTGTADSADTQRVVAGADGGLYITGLHGVVLTTAVGIANGTATAIPGTILTNRKSLIMYNSGTASIWLGGTGVTASNVGGLLVGTAEYSPAFDLGTAVVYGIAAAAGGTVTVLEVS